MYGQRIKELREERGWSQAKLAERMNCVQKTISRYELEQADLGTEVLLKFCEVFETSSDYILGIEGKYR